MPHGLVCASASPRVSVDAHGSAEWPAEQLGSGKPRVRFRRDWIATGAMSGIVRHRRARAAIREKQHRPYRRMCTRFSHDPRRRCNPTPRRPFPPRLAAWSAGIPRETNTGWISRPAPVRRDRSPHVGRSPAASCSSWASRPLPDTLEDPTMSQSDPDRARGGRTAPVATVPGLFSRPGSAGRRSNS
jgi:hypothetical protein